MRFTSTRFVKGTNKTSLPRFATLFALLPFLMLSAARAQETANSSPPSANPPKGEVTDVVRDKDTATITLRVPTSLLSPAVKDEALSSSADVVPLGVLSVPYTNEKNVLSDSIQVITAIRHGDKFWMDVKCLRLDNKGDKLEPFDGFTVAEQDTEALLSSTEPPAGADQATASADEGSTDANLAQRVVKNIPHGNYTYHYDYSTLSRYHNYVGRSRRWFVAAHDWATRGSQSRAANTSSSTGGTVSVKGYYRKDGTYVSPHTRSAPSSGGRRGH